MNPIALIKCNETNENQLVETVISKALFLDSGSSKWSLRASLPGQLNECVDFDLCTICIRFVYDLYTTSSAIYVVDKVSDTHHYRHPSDHMTT